MTVAQTGSLRGLQVSGGHASASCRCFLSKVGLLFPEPFSLCGRTELPSDHGFVYGPLFFILLFFHYYVYLFGITRGETYYSVAFQSTQAVCLHQVVNSACPSWQMHLSVSCGFLCLFGCQAWKLHSLQVPIKIFWHISVPARIDVRSWSDLVN